MGSSLLSVISIVITLTIAAHAASLHGQQRLNATASRKHRHHAHTARFAAAPSAAVPKFDLGQLRSCLSGVGSGQLDGCSDYIVALQTAVEGLRWDNAFDLAGLSGYVRAEADADDLKLCGALGMNLNSDVANFVDSDSKNQETKHEAPSDACNPNSGDGDFIAISGRTFRIDTPTSVDNLCIEMSFQLSANHLSTLRQASKDSGLDLQLHLHAADMNNGEMELVYSTCDNVPLSQFITKAAPRVAEDVSTQSKGFLRRGLSFSMEANIIPPADGPNQAESEVVQADETTTGSILATKEFTKRLLDVSAQCRVFGNVEFDIGRGTIEVYAEATGKNAITETVKQLNLEDDEAIKSALTLYPIDIEANARISAYFDLSDGDTREISSRLVWTTTTNFKDIPEEIRSEIDTASSIFGWDYSGQLTTQVDLRIPISFNSFTRNSAFVRLDLSAVASHIHDHEHEEDEDEDEAGADQDIAGRSSGNKMLYQTDPSIFSQKEKMGTDMETRGFHFGQVEAYLELRNFQEGQFRDKLIGGDLSILIGPAHSISFSVYGSVFKNGAFDLRASRGVSWQTTLITGFESFHAMSSIRYQGNAMGDTEITFCGVLVDKEQSREQGFAHAPAIMGFNSVGQCVVDTDNGVKQHKNRLMGRTFSSSSQNRADFTFTLGVTCTASFLEHILTKVAPDAVDTFNKHFDLDGNAEMIYTTVPFSTTDDIGEIGESIMKHFNGRNESVAIPAGLSFYGMGTLKTEGLTSSVSQLSGTGTLVGTTCLISGKFDISFSLQVLEPLTAVVEEAAPSIVPSLENAYLPPEIDDSNFLSLQFTIKNYHFDKLDSLLDSTNSPVEAELSLSTRVKVITDGKAESSFRAIAESLRWWPDTSTTNSIVAPIAVKIPFSIEDGAFRLTNVTVDLSFTATALAGTSNQAHVQVTDGSAYVRMKGFPNDVTFSVGGIVQLHMFGTRMRFLMTGEKQESEGNIALHGAMHDGVWNRAFGLDMDLLLMADWEYGPSVSEKGSSMEFCGLLTSREGFTASPDARQATLNSWNELSQSSTCASVSVEPGTSVVSGQAVFEHAGDAHIGGDACFAFAFATSKKNFKSILSSFSDLFKLPPHSNIAANAQIVYTTCEMNMEDIETQMLTVPELKEHLEERVPRGLSFFTKISGKDTADSSSDDENESFSHDSVAELLASLAAHSELELFGTFDPLSKVSQFTLQVETSPSLVVQALSKFSGDEHKSLSFALEKYPVDMLQVSGSFKQSANGEDLEVGLKLKYGAEIEIADFAEIDEITDILDWQTPHQNKLDTELEIFLPLERTESEKLHIVQGSYVSFSLATLATQRKIGAENRPISFGGTESGLKIYGFGTSKKEVAFHSRMTIHLTSADLTFNVDGSIRDGRVAIHSTNSFYWEHMNDFAGLNALVTAFAEINAEGDVEVSFCGSMSAIEGVTRQRLRCGDTDGESSVSGWARLENGSNELSTAVIISATGQFAKAALVAIEPDFGMGMSLIDIDGKVELVYASKALNIKDIPALPSFLIIDEQIPQGFSFYTKASLQTAGLMPGSGSSLHESLSHLSGKLEVVGTFCTIMKRYHISLKTSFGGDLQSALAGLLVKQPKLLAHIKDNYVPEGNSELEVSLQLGNYKFWEGSTSPDASPSSESDDSVELSDFIDGLASLIEIKFKGSVEVHEETDDVDDDNDTDDDGTSVEGVAVGLAESMGWLSDRKGGLKAPIQIRIPVILRTGLVLPGATIRIAIETRDEDSEESQSPIGLASYDSQRKIRFNHGAAYLVVSGNLNQLAETTISAGGLVEAEIFGSTLVFAMEGQKVAETDLFELSGGLLNSVPWSNAFGLGMEVTLNARWRYGPAASEMGPFFHFCGVGLLDRSGNRFLQQDASNAWRKLIEERSADGSCAGSDADYGSTLAIVSGMALFDDVGDSNIGGDACYVFTFRLDRNSFTLMLPKFQQFFKLPLLSGIIGHVDVLWSSCQVNRADVSSVLDAVPTLKTRLGRTIEEGVSFAAEVTFTNDRRSPVGKALEKIDPDAKLVAAGHINFEQNTGWVNADFETSPTKLMTYLSLSEDIQDQFLNFGNDAFEDDLKLSFTYQRTSPSEPTRISLQASYKLKIETSRIPELEGVVSTFGWAVPDATIQTELSLVVPMHRTDLQPENAYFQLDLSAISRHIQYIPGSVTFGGGKAYLKITDLGNTEKQVTSFGGDLFLSVGSQPFVVSAEGQYQKDGTLMLQSTSYSLWNTPMGFDRVTAWLSFRYERSAESVTTLALCGRILEEGNKPVLGDEYCPEGDDVKARVSGWGHIDVHSEHLEWGIAISAESDVAHHIIANSVPRIAEVMNIFSMEGRVELIYTTSTVPVEELPGLSMEAKQLFDHYYQSVVPAGLSFYSTASFNALQLMKYSHLQPLLQPVFDTDTDFSFFGTLNNAGFFHVGLYLRVGHDLKAVLEQVNSNSNVPDSSMQRIADTFTKSPDFGKLLFSLDIADFKFWDQTITEDEMNRSKQLLGLLTITFLSNFNPKDGTAEEEALDFAELLGYEPSEQGGKFPCEIRLPFSFKTGILDEEDISIKLAIDASSTPESPTDEGNELVTKTRDGVHFNGASAYVIIQGAGSNIEDYSMKAGGHVEMYVIGSTLEFIMEGEKAKGSDSIALNGRIANSVPWTNAFGLGMDVLLTAQWNYSPHGVQESAKGEPFLHFCGLGTWGAERATEHGHFFDEWVRFAGASPSMESCPTVGEDGEVILIAGTGIFPDTAISGTGGEACFGFGFSLPDDKFRMLMRSFENYLGILEEQRAFLSAVSSELMYVTCRLQTPKLSNLMSDLPLIKEEWGAGPVVEKGLYFSAHVSLAASDQDTSMRTLLDSISVRGDHKLSAGGHLDFENLSGQVHISIVASPAHLLQALTGITSSSEIDITPIQKATSRFTMDDVITVFVHSEFEMSRGVPEVKTSLRMTYNAQVKINECPELEQIVDIFGWGRPGDEFESHVEIVIPLNDSGEIDAENTYALVSLAALASDESRYDENPAIKFGGADAFMKVSKFGSDNVEVDFGGTLAFTAHEGAGIARHMEFDVEGHVEQSGAVTLQSVSGMTWDNPIGYEGFKMRMNAYYTRDIAGVSNIKLCGLLATSDGSLSNAIFTADDIVSVNNKGECVVPDTLSSLIAITGWLRYDANAGNATSTSQFSAQSDDSMASSSNEVELALAFSVSEEFLLRLIQARGDEQMLSVLKTMDIDGSVAIVYTASQVGIDKLEGLPSEALRHLDEYFNTISPGFSFYANAVVKSDPDSRTDEHIPDGMDALSTNFPDLGVSAHLYGNINPYSQQFTFSLHADVKTESFDGDFAMLLPDLDKSVSEHLQSYRASTTRVRAGIDIFGCFQGQCASELRATVLFDGVVSVSSDVPAKMNNEKTAYNMAKHLGWKHDDDSFHANVRLRIYVKDGKLDSESTSVRLYASALQPAKTSETAVPALSFCQTTAAIRIEGIGSGNVDIRARVFVLMELMGSHLQFDMTGESIDDDSSLLETAQSHFMDRQKVALLQRKQRSHHKKNQMSLQPSHFSNADLQARKLSLSGQLMRSKPWSSPFGLANAKLHLFAQWLLEDGAQSLHFCGLMQFHQDENPASDEDSEYGAAVEDIDSPEDATEYGGVAEDEFVNINEIPTGSLKDQFDLFLDESPTNGQCTVTDDLPDDLAVVTGIGIFDNGDEGVVAAGCFAFALKLSDGAFKVLSATILSKFKLRKMVRIAGTVELLLSTCTLETELLKPLLDQVPTLAAQFSDETVHRGISFSVDTELKETVNNENGPVVETLIKVSDNGLMLRGSVDLSTSSYHLEIAAHGSPSKIIKALATLPNANATTDAVRSKFPPIETEDQMTLSFHLASSPGTDIETSLRLEYQSIIKVGEVNQVKHAVKAFDWADRNEFQAHVDLYLGLAGGKIDTVDSYVKVSLVTLARRSNSGHIQFGGAGAYMKLMNIGQEDQITSIGGDLITVIYSQPIVFRMEGEISKGSIHLQSHVASTWHGALGLANAAVQLQADYRKEAGGETKVSFCGIWGPPTEDIINSGAELASRIATKFSEDNEDNGAITCSVISSEGDGDGDDDESPAYTLIEGIGVSPSTGEAPCFAMRLTASAAFIKRVMAKLDAKMAENLFRFIDFGDGTEEGDGPLIIFASCENMQDLLPEGFISGSQTHSLGRGLTILASAQVSTEIFSFLKRAGELSGDVSTSINVDPTDGSLHIRSVFTVRLSILDTLKELSDSSPEDLRTDVLDRFKKKGESDLFVNITIDYNTEDKKVSTSSSEPFTIEEDEEDEEDVASSTDGTPDNYASIEVGGEMKYRLDSSESKIVSGLGKIFNFVGNSNETDIMAQVSTYWPFHIPHGQINLDAENAYIKAFMAESSFSDDEEGGGHRKRFFTLDHSKMYLLVENLKDPSVMVGADALIKLWDQQIKFRVASKYDSTGELVIGGETQIPWNSVFGLQGVYSDLRLAYSIENDVKSSPGARPHKAHHLKFCGTLALDEIPRSFQENGELDTDVDFNIDFAGCLDDYLEHAKASGGKTSALVVTGLARDILDKDNFGLAFAVSVDAGNALSRLLSKLDTSGKIEKALFSVVKPSLVQFVVSQAKPDKVEAFQGLVAPLEGFNRRVMKGFNLFSNAEMGSGMKWASNFFNKMAKISTTSDGLPPFHLDIGLGKSHSTITGGSWDLDFQLRAGLSLNVCWPSRTQLCDDTRLQVFVRNVELGLQLSTGANLKACVNGAIQFGIQLPVNEKRKEPLPLGMYTEGKFCLDAASGGFSADLAGGALLPKDGWKKPFGIPFLTLYSLGLRTKWSAKALAAYYVPLEGIGFHSKVAIGNAVLMLKLNVNILSPNELAFEGQIQNLNIGAIVEWVIGLAIKDNQDVAGAERILAIKDRVERARIDAENKIPQAIADHIDTEAEDFHGDPSQAMNADSNEKAITPCFQLETEEERNVCKTRYSPSTTQPSNDITVNKHWLDMNIENLYFRFSPLGDVDLGGGEEIKQGVEVAAQGSLFGVQIHVHAAMTSITSGLDLDFEFTNSNFQAENELISGRIPDNFFRTERDFSLSHSSVRVIDKMRLADPNTCAQWCYDNFLDTAIDEEDKCYGFNYGYQGFKYMSCKFLSKPTSTWELEESQGFIGFWLEDPSQPLDTSSMVKNFDEDNAMDDVMDETMSEPTGSVDDDPVDADDDGSFGFDRHNELDPREPWPIEEEIRVPDIDNTAVVIPIQPITPHVPPPPRPKRKRTFWDWLFRRNRSFLQHSALASDQVPTYANATVRDSSVLEGDATALMELSALRDSQSASIYSAATCAEMIKSKLIQEHKTRFRLHQTAWRAYMAKSMVSASLKEFAAGVWEYAKSAKDAIFHPFQSIYKLARSVVDKQKHLKAIKEQRQQFDYWLKHRAHLTRKQVKQIVAANSKADEQYLDGAKDASDSSSLKIQMVYGEDLPEGPFRGKSDVLSQVTMQLLELDDEVMTTRSTPKDFSTGMFHWEWPFYFEHSREAFVGKVVLIVVNMFGGKMDELAPTMACWVTLQEDHLDGAEHQLLLDRRTCRHINQENKRWQSIAMGPDAPAKMLINVRFMYRPDNLSMPSPIQIGHVKLETNLPIPTKFAAALRARFFGHDVDLAFEIDVNNIPGTIAQFAALIPWGKLIDGLKTFVNRIAATIKALVKEVKDAIEAAFDAIKSFFSKIVGWFKKIGKAIASRIKDVAHALNLD